MEFISDLSNQEVEWTSMDPTPPGPTVISGRGSNKLPLNNLNLSSCRATSSVAKPRSKLSKHIASNRKLNVPVPKSPPLAFPASSSFTFSVADPASKLGASVKGESRPQTIQILPTDVLVTIIQCLKLRHHHWSLRSLSLVSRALNAAVAPLLYRHIRLPTLPDVYEFSLGPRHPGCISSLDINLSPDHQRRNWTPPDSNWVDGLMYTLRNLERLISLEIERGGNDSMLQPLVKLATDLTFLPALQNLSLGSWHQLSSLCPGRSITRYGVAFTLHEIQAYDRLEKLLITLSTSKEAIRELNITFNISPLEEASPTVDYQKRVLNLISKHMPSLRRLKVRFLWRDSKVRVHYINIIELAQEMPALKELHSLGFSDSHFPHFSATTIDKAAAALIDGGSCPKLQFGDFNGSYWKRTISTTSTSTLFDSTLPLHFSSLSLDDSKPIKRSRKH